MAIGTTLSIRRQIKCRGTVTTSSSPRAALTPLRIIVQCPGPMTCSSTTADGPKAGSVAISRKISVLPVMTTSRLNSSGIVVARHEPAPRVIFLNIATARGPPRSGDQSLYLLHNPLDRPATHFRPAPLRSEFHFHDLTSLLVSILETTQPPPIHVANEGVQI